ncbi:hypothetical protein I4U23_030341 [Adineta vaga]|nr:hypothetical protein I4U23_030341 [Adineta vaga]
MDGSIGIDTTEVDFKSDTNYNILTNLVAETTNSNGYKQPTNTNHGGTIALPRDQNENFHDVGTLFKQPLIISEKLESPYYARYKTDYFPRGGKNVGQPQSPRYVRTVDGDQEVTIEFPAGYKVPEHLGNYYLEIALLTVPRETQHYWHVHKLQSHHTDISVPDENPLMVPLTKEHFESGKVKLVVIKAKQDELKEFSSLTLFNAETTSNWTAECKTIEELGHIYELSRAKIAFSLVFQNSNGQYIRCTDTTVMSNEIIEKEKAKPSDDITCPGCSRSFSIKEQRKAEKKRSASASTMSKQKKRRSQFNQEII